MGLPVKTLVLFVFTGLLSTHILCGQIVNIESKRLGNDKEGLFGNFDLSASFTRNTSNIWQLNNQIKLRYLKGSSTFLALNDINRVQVDSSRFLNNGYQHLRYNYKLDTLGRFALEAFGQTQYNSIQLIKLRALLGGGVRLKVSKGDSLVSHIGFLVMREYEHLVLDYGTNRDTRLSSYFSFDWTINKVLRFNTITYYQPKLNSFGDFRLSNESTFIISVTKRFALKMIYNQIYDSEPPPGIPESIFSLRNSLSYSF